MSKKTFPVVEVKLDKIVGGGQALGTLEDGRKVFVWGGLPGETVRVQLTKKKSSYAEGVVTEVLEASERRIAPRDPDSYVSTSPWQIMDFGTEQHYKAALIEEAFELHDIVLPNAIDVYSDSRQYEYRNKIEYSFWYDTEKEQLDLAFFRRGTHGKITIDHTSLAAPAITQLSKTVLQKLRDLRIDGRALKTLLIRSNEAGETAWQLYVKDPAFPAEAFLKTVSAPNIVSGQVIHSDPRSPASVITQVLASSSSDVLTDTLLDVPFQYATEGFFQINLPVYQQALRDMQEWVAPGKPVVDMYSGVGTIGLTIGGNQIALVESNESAVREMRRNIKELGRETEVTAVLAPSETALDYITSDATVIVDPPRAGLHDDVVAKLLETKPDRIIYLSCNPVTQGRDVAKLTAGYGIRHHKGYNFFPRTPHIEHLIILDCYMH